MTDDTCHWSGCEQEATHIVNWTTERRREWLCDEHTERQRDSFQSEIQVRSERYTRATSGPTEVTNGELGCG